MANEKHIFIGIGGQGVKTVAKIKAKVYEKRFPQATATKTRLQAMNESYRFIFIDTDQRDIDEANKTNRASFEHGNVPFVNPQTDLINLGKANPAAIYYEAKKSPTTLINKRILEACSPELASKIPDQPLSFGAGAFRIKSRIAFAHALADFQSKLQAAISSLNDVKTVGGEDCIIYYWLVSSSLGGTGSGIFNDVLYHINQLHHQIVGNGDPQLVYTMYMPKVFIDANSTEEKYSLNAFGVFSELDAFKKMSYDPAKNTVMHRLAFNNDYNLVDTNKRYCPFYYLIPVDIQTDKGTSLGSTQTMIQNTAEMLYHLHNGQAGATFRSNIDNYMNDIMEKNHEEFLVPMGYVSLQKPQEQFNKYMRARFKRDVLSSWLLGESQRVEVKSEDVEDLASRLFGELNPDSADTVASDLLPGGRKLLNEVRDIDTEERNTLDEDYKIDAIDARLKSIKRNIEAEKEDSKREALKKIITAGIWKATEAIIMEHGLKYAVSAVTKVREHLKKEYERFNSQSNQDNAWDGDAVEKLRKLSEKTAIEGWEKINKDANKADIIAYKAELEKYVKDNLGLYVKQWAQTIKKDYCMDDQNDELSKLLRHLNGMIAKAEEMNQEAIKEYKKLATEFGDAAMDVTTVYLPMLKKICDGNGWMVDNFFSKQYAKVIRAEEDPAETPDRSSLVEFLDRNLYGAKEDMFAEDEKKIVKAYKVEIKSVPSGEDGSGAGKSTWDVRFFANPKLEQQGTVTSEKIIEDFLKLATSVFETKLHHNKDITESWDTRKIYSFFCDLPNEEKDEVRRALNPALFFSYNNNRIDVTKKEEHIIFVASSEDVAGEMLGYQKGNPKHRFEKSGDENMAIVLKSKFGLSLKDYRVYDSIKLVYDHASFRQKYHFHQAFAQRLDKLTLDDLGLEELPQHHSYVKMRLLNEFREELKPLFYTDEYDVEAYTDTMYYKEFEDACMIALPDALSTMDGKIALRKEADGRRLYFEIEGQSFVDRFGKYSELYHNERFGETTDRLIQDVIRASQPGKDKEGKDKEVRGEHILKEFYSKKWEKLLKEFNEKKKAATTPAEKLLFGLFFNLLRYKYQTYSNFIKS